MLSLNYGKHVGTITRVRLLVLHKFNDHCSSQKDLNVLLSIETFSKTSLTIVCNILRIETFQFTMKMLVPLKFRNLAYWAIVLYFLCVVYYLSSWVHMTCYFLI